VTLSKLRIAPLLALFTLALYACSAAGPAASPLEGTAARESGDTPAPLNNSELEPPDEQSDPLDSELVLYSGRSESLVGPIIEDFEAQTGIDVSTRWGDTAELAATLLEEGEASPADLFYAQDPGGLGSVADLFTPLPADLLSRVDPRFRDPEGTWVGITGRARVVVYSTDSLEPSDLPTDMKAFTDRRWYGRMGWAPTNASFQAMVTAMRALWGEDETRQWLEEMLANDPQFHPKNTPIVAAVGAGEIDVGFVNHYYLYRFLAEEGADFPARNYFLPLRGPGSLVMVSGAGVLETADHPEAAREFLSYLLSEETQRRFAESTFEYPLVEGVDAPAGLVPLEELNSPEIDLSELADLRGTLRLLRETGVLP
jgi:iron(III) transport system substrate-binding protein